MKKRKDTEINKGTDNILIMKVPRQCPFVFLVDVVCREDEGVGSGADKERR